MKSHLALASTLVLASLAVALAQPGPAPATAPAAAPAAGRGGPAPLAPPNPLPVGGTDNISDGDTVIGPDYVISDELRPHAAWATGELHEITMLARDSKIYPGRKRKVGYQADSTKAPGGRGNAVPEPLSVWQKMFFPSAFLYRRFMRRAWKSSKLLHDETSSQAPTPGAQTSRS